MILLHTGPLCSQSLSKYRLEHKCKAPTGSWLLTSWTSCTSHGTRTSALLTEAACLALDQLLLFHPHSRNN
jgi:hypothetical protein